MSDVPLLPDVVNRPVLRELEGMPGGCGVYSAVLNMLMSAFGVGVLALPSAVAKGGWFASICLMLVGADVVYFTCILIWRSMAMGTTRITTFEGMGKAVGGLPLKITLCCSVYLYLTCLVAALIIIVGEGAYNLIPYFQPVQYCLIASALMLPTVYLPSLKEVTFTSAAGVVAMACVLAAIVAAAIHNRIAPVEPIRYEAIGHQVSSMGLAVAINLGSFRVAEVMPTLISSMENPSRYPYVCKVSIGIMLIVNASVAFVAYSGWGQQLLHTEVMTAVARTAFSMPVQIGLLVMVVCKFPVQFSPIALAADRATKHALRNCGISEKPQRLLQMLTRTAAYAAAVGIACTVNDFLTMLGLLYATLGMMHQVFVPILFFCILERHLAKQGVRVYASRTQQVEYMLLMATCFLVGLFGMVMGIWNVVLTMSQPATLRAGAYPLWTFA